MTEQLPLLDRINAILASHRQFRDNAGISGLRCSCGNTEPYDAHIAEYIAGQLPQLRGVTVSDVKWCDAGNHAFKAGTPGSQTFRGTYVNEEGMSVVANIDTCPEHAFRPSTADAQAIEAPHVKVKNRRGQDTPPWGSDE